MAAIASSRARLVVFLVAAGTMLIPGCSATASSPSASSGVAQDRPVPAAVADVPLVNQTGRSVTLASLQGKVVVIAPFLTLCQEICPLTTGNLIIAARELSSGALAGTVAILEVSVDPARDTPARLSAYARLTGTRHELVTETPEDLATLARFFGWYYGTAPEPSPPGTDWWTGAALTYDMAHSDGFDVIDAHGHLRFASGANPAYRGPIPPHLAALLDSDGRRNLTSPGTGSWTAQDVVQAVRWASQS